MHDEEQAIDNARNRHARGHKTILCVCSAGLLRSPTLAWWLSQEKNGGYNTRAAGVGSYALIPVSTPLIEWADEIICMGKRMDHEEVIRNMDYFKSRPKPIYSLGIPDKYEYRDKELVGLIEKAMSDLEIMKGALK